MTRSFLNIFLLVGLVACGGGGDVPSTGNSTTESSASMTTAASDQTASTACCSANQPPMFGDLPDEIRVNENQKQILTVTATDSDEDMLTYSLAGTDADLLQISQTGDLTFIDAPDFETQNSYAVSIQVTDGVDTSARTLTINITDVAETVSQAPVELVVVVEAVTDGYSSGNKYSIDGEITPTITLAKGKTYRFLQSDTSNNNHPVRFSLTSNGTHNNGTAMVDGISFVGLPGSTGAYTQLQIPADSNLTSLYYFCSNHSGMGGAILVSAENPSGYEVFPRAY